MKVPRFTISDVMALTVLAALDCLAWRDDSNAGVVVLRLIFLPSLNLLVVASYVLVRGIRRGDPPRFLIGFVVAGWPLFLLYAYMARDIISDALNPFRGVEVVSFDWPEWIVALTSTLLLLPALVVGLIVWLFGAWRHRRRGLVALAASHEA